MAPRLVVVCGPDRAPALPQIWARFALAGCVRVGRGGTSDVDAPTFATLAESLSAADAVAVLSPYRGLAADLAECRRQGLPVAVAGPPTAEAADGDFAPGRWRHSPAMDTVDEVRRSAAFGRPVYLRHVTGGGSGWLNAWWATLEALEAATCLLDAAPERLWIGASASGGRWHVTATLVVAGGASAQLVVTPAPAPGDEVMLLGTGGLVQVDSGSDASHLRRAGGEQRLAVPAAWPDAEWIAAALDGPGEARLSRGTRAKVQRALRNAVRQGALVPVLP
jgi:hypothetical protein